jgi:outer membrane receptor protein involved in Fe transport
MSSKHVRRALLLATAVLLQAMIAIPASYADDDGDDDDDDVRKPVDIVVVTAQRLDDARAGIEPGIGASSYSISNETVENRPGSETTTINQVMLQMPGVTQAGSGDVRVRGGSDLQYRVNGVIIPEGLSDLGETLSPRIADKVELVTGALPAEYGLQVNGVVNITTKSGAYTEGGQAELYGGSHSDVEPAVEYTDTIDGTNLFFTADYLHSNRGLSSPTSRSDPAHDTTDQIDGLAYFDRTIGANARVSLILAGTNEQFQIPTITGANAQNYPFAFGFQRPLQVNGQSAFASGALNEHQGEANHFVVASYLVADDDWSLQVSLFGQASRFEFRPDVTGDVLFYGSAQNIRKNSLAGGTQVEGTLNVGDDHIVRAGVIIDESRTHFNYAALAVPVNGAGVQTSGTPVTVASFAKEPEDQMSAFLQDEWHPADGLTVNGGIRFDYVRELQGVTRFSPRLNVVYTTADDTTFHAGYSRYFVPAPADESDDAVRPLAPTSGRYPGVSGNPLRAETDDYYDAGVRKTVDAFSFGLDGYWRAAANLLDSGFFAASPIAQSFNFRSARVAGVELNATYAQGPLTGWANLAVAEARGSGIVSNQFFFTPAQLALAAGRNVPLSTDQQVTASLGGSYHWGAFLFSGQLTYGSGLPSKIIDAGFSGVHAVGHAQLDLSGVYRLAVSDNQSWDFRIDVMNLFDNAFLIQDGAGPAGSLPQWGARREIYAGVEVPF